MSLWLPQVLAEALDPAGAIATWSSRLQQGQALIKGALELALEYELPAAALHAFNNLRDVLNRRDRCEEAVAQLEQGIALARRVGDRAFERRLAGELCWPLVLTGRWLQAFAFFDELPEERAEQNPAYLVEPVIAQGRLDDARHLLAIYARHEHGADLQQRTGTARSRPRCCSPKGRIAKRSPPPRRACCTRFDPSRGPGGQGRIPAGARGGERDRARAAATFREFGMPFWLAVTLTEYGEWLIGEGRSGEAEPMLAEARETFERLEATPWLDRAEAAATPAHTEVHA
jgi:hypothetical protein